MNCNQLLYNRNSKAFSSSRARTSIDPRNDIPTVFIPEFNHKAPDSEILYKKLTVLFSLLTAEPDQSKESKPIAAQHTSIVYQ
jgi:hypothetical protein